MTFEKRSTRRDFFRQSAVAAGTAPAVLGTAGRSFGQVGKSDLLCGIIGTGNRGKSVLRGVVGVPGVRVAAICEINPKMVEEAREIVGDHKPDVYTYHLDMLDRKDLDAILVETPPHLHREQVIDALRAGKACSVAKPLALTVNEMNHIEETVKAISGILHVDQQLRYRPQYQKAMPRIHSGEIGKVGFIRAQRYGSWNGQITIGEYQIRKAWLYRVEQSGDTMVENQVHNMDVINWVMNDHPIRCSGLGGQNMISWAGNELLDNYNVTFEYPGNRYAAFSKISYAVSGLSGTFIHAYAEKAGADVSYEDEIKFIWRGKDPAAATIIKADKPFDGNDQNRFSIEDFFNSIRTGKQPFVDVGIGKTAALTTLLARKAVYEKRNVTWDDLLTEGSAPRPRRS